MGVYNLESFYRSTFVLIIAAFFSECIEFFINMILARELKEVGMGLYMSILPIFFLIYVIASLELHVSISKFVAESKKNTYYSLLKHAFKLSITAIIILIISIPVILSVLPLMDQYHPLIKWSFTALVPIAAFSSIARGFFIGVQQMNKIAVSNFLKKGFQFILLFGIFNFFQYDQETALLMALFILIGSEFLVFVYLFTIFLFQMRNMRNEPQNPISKKFARKKLLEVSVPTMALRIFHALIHAIQPILIHTALISAGFGALMATEHFGMLTGVAMTIGFFPAFIAHSLMVMLIPNVSEAYKHRNIEKLRMLLQQSMFFTFLYGVPACFIIYVFAEPLTHLFFSSSTAAFYVQLLWPYFLFHFFMIPLQAFLIGLGLIKDVFIQTVWAQIVTFGLMLALGSRVSLNMEGIILGMNTGAILLTSMHYLTICKKTDINIWLMKKNKTIV